MVYSASVCPVMQRTLATKPAEVNPLGAGVRASTADRALRAGLVEVDPADPGRPHLGGAGQLLQHPIGDEADVNAVEHGAEAVSHRGKSTNCLAQLVQYPPAA